MLVLFLMLCDLGYGYDFESDLYICVLIFIVQFHMCGFWVWKVQSIQHAWDIG